MGQNGKIATDVNDLDSANHIVYGRPSACKIYEEMMRINCDFIDNKIPW